MNTNKNMNEEKTKKEEEDIIKKIIHHINQNLQKDWKTEKKYNEVLVDVVNYLKTL